tara:strand:+ start:128 stop:460 length:333 start_codon:yes stop_codon:yes gene_type:complete
MTQTIVAQATQNEKNISNEVVGRAKGNLPERKFRAGAISATVWLNKGQRADGEETEYRTISLERSYTDKEGNWQSTNSFRINDLPKARLVLQRAFESIVLNEQELFNASA